MLSKKMAFSLTSLITILALAFVVTPAMAATFSVSLDTSDDKSATAGLQLSHPGDADLSVVVKFGEPAKLMGAKVFATTYDKNGKLVSIPTVTADPEDTAAAKVTLKIPVKTAVETVKLKIKAGDIAAANPLSKNTSAALDTFVDLVGEDEGGPTVYSIERVGVNFRQLVTPKINPTANSEVQVRVTLSEFPKAFGKAHISASNAAVTTVEALVPEMGPSLVDYLADDDTPEIKDLPRKRMIYDEDIPAGTTGDAYTTDATIRLVALATTTGSVDDAVVRKAKVDARGKYGGIHRAINEGQHLADAYKYKEVPALTLGDGTALTATADNISSDNLAVAINLEPEAADKVFGTDYILLNYVGDATTDAAAAPGDPGDAVAKPTKPEVKEYRIAGSFAAAVRKYAVDFEKYRVYQNKKTLQEGYKAALEKEQMKDDEKRAEFYADNVGRADQGHVATGSDMMLYPYLVTLTPTYLTTADIVVKVKAFEDRTSPVSLKYTPPVNADEYVEGVDMLTIGVSAAKTPDALTAGFKVNLPKDLYIPAGGYLIVAENKAGSAIHIPGGPTDKAAAAHERNDRERKYNVVETADLPNLETFLINGIVIDVMSPHALVITEVMWGSDESLANPAQSQWIELYNAGAAYKTGEKANATSLIFYSPGDSLPLKSTVKDRIGTIDADGIYWGNQLPGQRGRTGAGEAAATLVATTPTKELVSMNRVMTAGVPADGQASGSWVAHSEPAVNFSPNAVGRRIASPGAERIVTAAETAAKKQADLDKAKAEEDKRIADAEKQASTGTWPLKGDGRVYISEVMFAGGGTLPQWIEIANGDRAKEFNLSGWTLTVDNAAADTDAAVSSATFTIPDGTTVSPSAQHDTPSTVLIVTEGGRTNIDDGTGDMGADQIINLAVDNEVELIGAGILKGKYALLSGMAFKVTLSPPKYEAMKPPADETAAAKKLRQANEKKERTLRAEAVDTVGNLGADGTAAWALPMSEGGARSSIIRRHLQVTRGPASPEDGMMEASWVLASETSFAQVTHIRASSYYGAANDVGSPGFRAGGALPVELSHFRPARDKITDAVVITWATESELNNAGFFIKRSNQPNGQFQVVNATMIPGAGTTSEKQFYTYTDTTAQPNVVYYYQIEDVSLDGNRQTLTRGIRLKGHVGAAGKATVIWGELKTSHE